MKYDDTIPVTEIASICHRLISESATRPFVDTLSEMDELADIQWHTYESQEETVIEEIEEWFTKNWKSDQEFFEALLGIGYCFGFRKELYKKGLELYDGEHNEEFRLNYENSSGNRIDPWWSLRNRKAQSGSRGHQLPQLPHHRTYGSVSGGS